MNKKETLNELKTQAKILAKQAEAEPENKIYLAEYGQVLEKLFQFPPNCDPNLTLAEVQNKNLADINNIRATKWMESFMVSDEEMEQISDPEWLFKNVIIRGHFIAIVAPPNGGKTTILMWIAEQLSASVVVVYVNADVSGTDAKKYHSQAKKAGFKLLLPDMVTGLSMEDVVKNLEVMNATETDYSNMIFIFDTLKKMTDVVNKNTAKRLYKTLRGLTAKGMTIVVLGHTNKYPDSEGKYVYEGTGDLRSDVDELIYLYPKHNEDKSMTVSTDPDKKRGEFEAITFKISADRQVSLTSYVDTAEENRWENQKEKDSHIIEAIFEALDNQCVSQSQIAGYCAEKYHIGDKSVIRVLKRFSCGKNRLWEAEKGLQNNRINYRKKTNYAENSALGPNWQSDQTETHIMDF